MLALTASLSSAAHAQWTQTPSGHPYNYWEAGFIESASGPEHLNNSSQTIQVSGSYTYTLWNQVTGAADTSPPWSGPFASLFNLSQSVMREYTKDLPAGKGCIVFDKLAWVDAGETWFESPELRTRHRLVYTVVKLKHQQLWNLGGSGGGG